MVNEILDQLVEAIKLPITYLFNPTKRIYGLYLFSSTLLAFFVWYKSKQKTSFFNYLFNRKIWFSNSAIVDYFFIFFNGLIKIFLIAPFLILGLTLSFHVNEILTSYGLNIHLDWPIIPVLILYTLCITIIGDFASYIVHFAMHKWEWLWEFHKIHHSATTLNPITQYRLHPIELIINNAKNILVFGLVTGVFDYLSIHPIQKIYFLGANVFSFIFLFWGANLRHSHVKLKYFSWLENIFISPIQHQIHHSDNPIHFDKNMGAKLAIWDWLFGTLIKSDNIGKLKFGLGKNDNINYVSFWQNLYMPFYNIFKKWFT